MVVVWAMLSRASSNDVDGLPGEPIMIEYFWEGLKPLIYIEMEQHSRELDNFKEVV